MKVSATALAIYSTSCQVSTTSAFQIVIPRMVNRKSIFNRLLSASSLRYRDEKHNGPPEVDVYTPVSAEVLCPDVAIPPSAKRVFVVSDEENNDDEAQEETTSSKNEPPSVWTTSKAQTIEGGSLKTWTMDIPEISHVQLLLKNNGTPLNAKADVFCGPGNAPMQLAVYSDNGARHPFSGVICTPYMVSHSIGVKNSGAMDHPLGAVILADMEHLYNQRKSTKSKPSSFTADMTPGNLSELARTLLHFGTVQRIQGGDAETFVFHKPVESVQILLKTDGRPCQARMELCCDGENTIAQVVEVYSEDGYSRPFFAVLDTPGLSNMVRVVNVGDHAFPISACVEPFTVDAHFDPNNRSSTDHTGVQEIDFDRPSPPRPFSEEPFIPGGGDFGNIPGIADDVGFFFVD